jgi:hypothetical protein
MPAWNHTNSWNGTFYDDYRKYVRFGASAMKGRLEDCADLSMLLIVEFAAMQGLPLTFTDNREVRYSSRAASQFPTSGVNITYTRTDVNLPTGGVTFMPGGGLGWETAPLEIPTGVKYAGDKNYTWINKDEFYLAIKNRINAAALYKYNTEVNPLGPQSGDLLSSKGHAGLVIDAYPVGLGHPKASDMSIAPWVSPESALKEVNVLEYFRDNHGVINDENKLKVHFDYLNHRDEAKPKAELIYFRRAEDAISDGFEFRKYNAKVLS